MNKRSLLQSFKYAVEGIIYCIKTQRNMRIHILAILFVVTGSLFLRLTRYDMALILLTMTMVVVCEMINTSIEKAVDIYTEKYHPLAKIAKDVAAGAVLVSAINSVLIGYLLLINKIVPYTGRIMDSIKSNDIHTAFVSIIVVLVIVLVIKYLLNHKKIVQGGMPSGHSAVAFSLVTAIFTLGENAVVGLLALALGILIVQSRIEAKIHTLGETLAGALLGIAITYLLFKLAGG